MNTATEAKERRRAERFTKRRESLMLAMRKDVAQLRTIIRQKPRPK